MVRTSGRASWTRLHYLPSQGAVSVCGVGGEGVNGDKTTWKE